MFKQKEKRLNSTFQKMFKRDENQIFQAKPKTNRDEYSCFCLRVSDRPISSLVTSVGVVTGLLSFADHGNPLTDRGLGGRRLAQYGKNQFLGKLVGRLNIFESL
jgi:hypothetical protein